MGEIMIYTGQITCPICGEKFEHGESVLGLPMFSVDTEYLEEPHFEQTGIFRRSISYACFR